MVIRPTRLAPKTEFLSACRVAPVRSAETLNRKVADALCGLPRHRLSQSHGAHWWNPGPILGGIWRLVAGGEQ